MRLWALFRYPLLFSFHVFPNMSEEINLEEKQLIEEEESILHEVLESLQTQTQFRSERLAKEDVRARELTSQLVAATREEDKAMLASDEAVSHALKDQNRADLKDLNKLLKKPYFARFRVEEEDGQKKKELEYRLGFAANPECRIVDWRKAPISKLYYEYREGDEYCEQIQSREREGKIILRNALEIEQQELKSIRCRYGTFEKDNGTWRKGASQSSHAGQAGQLPHLLSLITPEQFQTITEDATTAILIQGIAGSGKTSVALHRLAWLLHEDNSDLSPEECVVLVHSKALLAYIEHTLPSMGIAGVRLCTFQDWAKTLLTRHSPEYFDNEGQLKTPDIPSSTTIRRLKSSLALLDCLEESTRSLESGFQYHELLLSVLSNPKKILERDNTKLLDADTIKKAWVECSSHKSAQVIDQADFALLIRCMQLRGLLPTPLHGHIVVDEVQDRSPAELAALVGSVKEPRHMTLVGDTAQQLSSQASFPGWSALRKHWAFKDDLAKFVSLTVSHRSTLPIMRLAEHVQGESKVTHGRQGRVPLWFKCHTETRAINSIIDWLTKALERYPTAMTAVLCANPAEAKHALSLLEPTFGSGARLGDEYSFSFEEGIVVTDVRQVKGLEFTNVLLWNPTSSNYPGSSQARNMLYVAMTRAAENLCLVTWGKPSPLLPHVHSRLIRGITEELPEDE